MSLNHLSENNIQTLVKNAMLSKNDTEQKYSRDPRYSSHLSAQAESKDRIKSWLKKQREINKNLSDSEFISTVVSNYMAPVLKGMAQEFGNIISSEKMQKLLGLMEKDNIKVIDNPSEPDMQTSLEDGEVIFNLAQIKNGTEKDFEDQIVSIIGRIIHEALKLIVNIKKRKTEKDALINYKLSSGKVITLPTGTAGQMIEAGYIEKLASEFAEKYGFYYEMSPANIPFADICTYMMGSNNKLDDNFMLNNDYEEILSQLDPKDAELIKEAENIAILTHGEDESTKEYENIDPEIVEQTWREDSEAEERLDPDEIDESIDAIAPTVPSVNSPTDEEKKEEEAELLDKPIEEPDPNEVENIMETNVAYLNDHPLTEEEKADALEESQSIKTKNPVLTLRPLKEITKEQNGGFVSLIALISVIFAFISVITVTIMYFFIK